MPRNDGTGPRGQGALTGRGLGPCYNDEDYRPRRSVGRGLARGACRRKPRGFGPAGGQGRTFGPGRGLGRGFRNMPNGGNEREFLEKEKRILEDKIDLIDRDLENL